MDLNCFSGTARLTKDAVLQHVGANGTALLKMDLANNTGLGQYSKVQFFSAVLWGKQATALSPYLLKGQQIAFTGTLESNDYTKQNGEEVKGWQMTLKDVVLLGGKKQEADIDHYAPPPDGNLRPAVAVYDGVEAQDIPF